MSKEVQINKELKVKNDIVFKELFSKEGNQEFLIDFLSNLLKIKINRIEIYKENELKKHNIYEKSERIDLRVNINEDKIIDIEIQLKDNKNIIERTTKYASDIMSKQLKRGDDYKKIKQVIVITIADYIIWPEYKGYIHKSMMVLEDHRDYELNKYIRYYYIELPKFRKREEKNYEDKVEQWLTFIDDESKEEVEKVMKKNELIKKAKVEFKYYTGDEEVQRMREIEERNYRDKISELAYERDEGKKEGKKEGKIIGMELGIKKVAKMMLKNGVNINMICKYTNLSKEEVSKIKI